MRSGDRVRITAELIDAATDRHVWANTYERKIDDVLTLQSAVAREIAGEIRASMTARESGRLARSRSVPQAALEAYLKGRYYWGEFTAESLTKSIESFDQATNLDPSYAAAWAGLGEAWTGLGWMGARPWRELRDKAMSCSMKAIDLDAGLSEGHAAMALFSLLDWDWKTALAEDQTAIKLNPGYPTAHMSYGNILRFLGRVDEGIAEAKRAVELDPLATVTNQVLAQCYISWHRYDLAAAQCQSSLELHPDDSTLHYLLGWAWFYQQKYNDAVAELKKSSEADGIDPEFSPDLAYIHAVTGRKDLARKTLKQLLPFLKEEIIDAGHLALIYLGLGQRREGLDMLEQAYRNHSSMMKWLKVDARFDDIRGEPRFQNLMRGVGLM
jgi:tetratricopeptide (TPR) repeat protein